MDNNKIKVANFLNSFHIVSALGFGIMILGTLKIFGVLIPTTFLLGVAISSTILVIIDFLVYSNTKIPLSIMTAIVMLLNYSAIIIIVCSPYLSFFSEENTTLITDSVSLSSFGLTIALIGTRGVKDLNRILKEKNKKQLELEKLLLERTTELELYKGLVEQYEKN